MKKEEWNENEKLYFELTTIEENEYLLKDEDFNLKSPPLSVIKTEVLKRKLVADSITAINERKKIRQIIEDMNKGIYPE